MEGVGDRSSDLLLPDGFRSDGVNRSLERVVVDRAPVEPDEIAEVDPGQPLSAGAEPAAGEEPEREDERAERRRPPVDCERSPHEHDAETELLGGEGGGL